MHIFTNKNFKRFLISYICVFLLPFAITIFSYSHAADIIENNVIEANTFRLSTFRDILDGKISMIDRSVLYLNLDEGLRSIAHLPFADYNSPNMYRFSEFHHTFNRFNFNNAQEGDNSFLFLRHNGAVFGRNFFSSRLSEIYDMPFRRLQLSDYGTLFQFGDMTYEAFSHFLFHRQYHSYFMPAEQVTLVGNTGLYIPYVFSMPAIAGIPEYDTERIWGTMVYLLNVDEIYDMMTSPFDEYGGETFILKENLIIASTNGMQGGFLDLDITTSNQGGGVNEIIWEGRDMLAIYMSSNYSQLSFLTLLPLDEIRSDMIMLRNIVAMLFVITFLVGLVISTALSYRNTLPITRLLTSNADLQALLKAQHQSLEMLYVNKLLKNDFADRKDLELGLKHVKIEFGGNGYRVILVRILPNSFIFSNAPLDDWDMYQAFFINLVPSEYKTHTLSHNELAIIADFKPEDNIENIISQIQERFNKQFGFVPLCGIGEEYSIPAEIHYSMQEALAAADYADAHSVNSEQKSHIVWYRDITSGDIFELFGKDQEQMLFNLVRQGDEDALEAHLDSIYTGARYRSLSSGIKQLYLAHLHTVLMRMSADTRIEIDFKSLEKQSKGKHEVYFELLKEAYKQICSQLRKSKKGRKQKLKESILAFIDEHYCDSGLSVAMLAAHFNVAENYFSQFFSEQVGEPFSRYLERIRIEHAAKLLTEVNMTVDQVALKSGYNNTNTFRRAFKRVTGTTPSEYVKV